MSYDVMLDLETLSTRPTAAILSIGACTFDRVTGEIFERFHDRVDPDLDKYAVDLSTVRFWLKQSEEARASLARPAVLLFTALERFNNWFHSCARPEAKVWALPASFDLPILTNAYVVEKMIGGVPWRYDAPRDLRTLFDLAKIEKKDRVQPKLAHDALSDCEAQVGTLVLAFNRLGQGI